MCTSFTIPNYKEIFDRVSWHDFSEGQIVATRTVQPKSHAPVLVKSGDGSSYGLVTMAWGFQVSSENVDTNQILTGKYINARWENLSLSNTWKESYCTKRAVLTVRSFYHRHQQFVLTNSDIMHLAVVYDDVPCRRFAIISRPSYEPVKAYHPRSPMILTDDGVDIWLDPKLDPHLLETFTTFAALHYKPSLTLLH